MGRQSRRKSEARKERQNSAMLTNSSGWFYRPKIFFGAAGLVAAAFFGEYLLSPQKEHKQLQVASSVHHRSDNDMTLDDLILNPNYILFDTLTKPIENDMHHIKRFDEIYQKFLGAREPDFATVSVTSEMRISLLPHNGYFKGLAYMLNMDLSKFVHFLQENGAPDEITRQKHEVVLIHSNKNIKDLPFSIDGIAQIYLVNSQRQTEYYTGSDIKGKPFVIPYNIPSKAGMVSSTYELNQAGNVIFVERRKIYISPDFSETIAKYTNLLNTALSEYLHSALLITKVKNILTFIQMNRVQNLNTGGFDDVLSYFGTLDEGITHATILYYLEMSDDKNWAFVERYKNTYRTASGYEMVQGYYDAIKELNLPPHLKAIIPVNAFYNNAISELGRGKQGLIDYASKMDTKVK